MYSRARALADVPTARLPIVPASMPTCARAFASEKSPLGREQARRDRPASAATRSPRDIAAGYFKAGLRLKAQGSRPVWLEVPKALSPEPSALSLEPRAGRECQTPGIKRHPHHGVDAA